LRPLPILPGNTEDGVTPGLGEGWSAKIDPFLALGGTIARGPCPVQTQEHRCRSSAPLKMIAS
jgi:hypothetical protein